MNPDDLLDAMQDVEPEPEPQGDPHARRAGEGPADTGAGNNADSMASAEALRLWDDAGYTVAEFMKLPPQPWHVDGWLRRGDMALLYGESGHGKTFVVMSLAWAAATGTPFANRFAIERPQTVVYLAGEGTGGLPRRLKASAVGFDQDAVNFYVYNRTPNLFLEVDGSATNFVHHWRHLAATGRRPETVDLLFIDTYATAIEGANENDGKDVGKILANVRLLRDTLAGTPLGCTVVLIHHTNKGGTWERGHGALRAGVEVRFRVSKVGSSYTLTPEKVKDDQQPPPQSFSLVAAGDVDSVRCDWHGDAAADDTPRTHKDRTLQWLTAAGDWRSAREIADGIGLQLEGSRAIYTQLDALVDAGVVERKGTKPNTRFRVRVSTDDVQPVDPALDWLRADGQWRTAAEVAQAVNQSSAAILTHLNTLVEAGAVERQGKPSARTFRARVTK